MLWKTERSRNIAIVTFSSFLTVLSANATEVVLVGSMGTRAVLTVDGGPPRVVAAGSTVASGVRLISVEGDTAVVELEGRQRILRIGSAAIQRSLDDRPSVTLFADSRGHFVSDAVINGARVRFLVDTGATLVSLGRSDAERARIDYRRGRSVAVQTAAGVVQVWQVTLDSLQVGSLGLRNVDAVVFEDDLPTVLLGMSALNRMDMQRHGNALTLQRR